MGGLQYGSVVLESDTHLIIEILNTLNFQCGDLPYNGLLNFRKKLAFPSIFSDRLVLVYFREKKIIFSVLH